METTSSGIDFAKNLRRHGFCFVPGDVTRDFLRPEDLKDWAEFASSWDDLIVDHYLAKHGRFRRRRHATYISSSSGSLQRAQHRAHFQTSQHNLLQGGIERWFEPLTEKSGSSDSLNSILQFGAAAFNGVEHAHRRWLIEVHQFRIEAAADLPGQPTPEGVHRDGVDYVLVLLVRRKNIESGTTTIHASNGELLGEFTLTAPFDVALLVDARVFHGVTPVYPTDPWLPAYRDVLVVTYRKTD